MEELEALLKDLESSGTLRDPQKSPKISPGTPPGHLGQHPPQGSGEELEQLYRLERTPLPPPRAPPPPGLGELERDLRGTRSDGGGELLAQTQKEPKFGGSPPGRDPQNPPKFGAGPPKSAATRELDRLLESLAEFHLQEPQAFPSQGGSGIPQNFLGPPKCERCRQPVLGVVVTALGRSWHPEHFCCSHCGDVLGEQGFRERSGLPFCRRDFGALFGPRCRGCREPVLDEFVAALGGTWHPQCFVCQDCRAPFPGGSFFHLGGVPLCQRHFRERGEGQGWGRG